jgi:hypothetical protein
MIVTSSHGLVAILDLFGEVGLGLSLFADKGLFILFHPACSEWIRTRYSPNITGTDRRSVCNPDFLRDKTSLTSEVRFLCSNFNSFRVISDLAHSFY